MRCAELVSLGRVLRHALRGSRAFTLLLAPLAGLAVAPTQARAQLAVDHVELLLDPTSADQRIGLFSVRNEGSKAVQAVVRLEDWDRAEDGTNRWYPDGTLPGSCGAGLTIFPASVQLAPGQSQTVRVSLDSVPAGRECWGAAILETRQPRVVSGRSVVYVLRTAVKIYAGSPTLRADGMISRLAVSRSSAPADSGRPRIDAVFSNTGERHLIGRGTLEFRRPDNSVAARIALPDAYALPGAEARVSALGPELPAGRYIALALLDYGGDEIAAAQAEYQAP